MINYFARNARAHLKITLPIAAKIYIFINIDEFVKSRIHQVFGVSCLVFGIKYMMLYRYVRILNTKHQIQNTLVKSSLF